MLDKLDKTIFLLLNSFNSPFWDRIMWIISGKITWVPLYLAIIFLLSKQYRRKMMVLIPVIILAVVISDQLSVHAFKEVFMRLRPCHEPALEGMVHIVNGKCGGKFGFVSSHAANSFSVAVISLLLVRKRWYSVTIISWATIVGYSRIYLGVHYPGDVICGAILGAITGYLVYLGYRLIDLRMMVASKYFQPKDNRDVPD